MYICIYIYIYIYTHSGIVCTKHARIEALRSALEWCSRPQTTTTTTTTSSSSSTESQHERNGKENMSTEQVGSGARYVCLCLCV